MGGGTPRAERADGCRTWSGIPDGGVGWGVWGRGPRWVCRVGMMTMAVGCGAGNAALHTLTASGPTELRVDLRTQSDSAFARYRDFAVSGPEDNFRLHLGAYSGTAGVCGAVGGPGGY